MSETRDTYRTDGYTTFKVGKMDIYDYWRWKYPRMVEDPVLLKVAWNAFAAKARLDVNRELYKPNGLLTEALD